MRVADWDARFDAMVAANFNRPHSYADWHCMDLVAADVAALTGEDLGATHRGKFKSHATAVRYLKRLGFDSPAAMLDSLFTAKPIGFAQRGDIALVPAELGMYGWDIPGIVTGSFALIVGTDGARDGLVRIPRALWLKAWAV